jgi:hemerythrin-like metal-binding protein
MGKFLNWQEKWNTEIPDIDKQNLELANQLNRIVDELQKTKGQQYKQNSNLESLLSEFYDLTLDHFNAEEALMRTISYPRYASHRQEHVMLKAEMAQLIREIKQGQSRLDMGTLRALKHWYVAHLAGPDRDYADYYHAIN